MQSTKTRDIATGGILLALSVITLFGATTMPGIELTLYLLSSVYVTIVVIELKPRMAFLFFFASLILSFVLIPNKVGLIPYLFYFGIYPVAKYYIEKGRKFSRPMEIVLKLVICNAALVIGYLIFGELVIGSIKLPDLPMPALLITVAVGVQVLFLLSDYILTLVIGFYLNRRPK